MSVAGVRVVEFGINSVTTRVHYFNSTQRHYQIRRYQKFRIPVTLGGAFKNVVPMALKHFNLTLSL